MSDKGSQVAYLKTLPESCKRGFKVPDMRNLFGNARPGKALDQSGPCLSGFRVAPDVTASIHSEGVVLFHLGRGTIFNANRVGAMIWSGAVERWSLDRVAASISNEFSIAAPTARQDAAEFLAQLAAEGLLVTEGS